MIVAPFFGEFGWEVALWAPWLRHERNKRYPHSDFVVMCKPGHEGLYQDFATKIEVKEPPPLTYIDCQHAWTDGVKLRPADYVDMCRGRRERMTKSTVLTPFSMIYYWNPLSCPKPTSHAEFRMLGDKGKHNHLSGKLIAVHARACLNKQPGRNWPRDKWADLVKNMSLVAASIGSKADAMHVPNTEDMRGLPLAELCNALAACRYVIGPSSGPLHLANHCATPVIWWSGNKKDEERYETAWNPWKVDNVCASRTWDPDLEKVLAKL